MILVLLSRSLIDLLDLIDQYLCIAVKKAGKTPAHLDREEKIS